MDNLIIKETWIEIEPKTEKRFLIGENEPYETWAGKDETGKLFRSLQKEYGRASKMYVEDKEGKSKQVGWVFTGRAYYEDTKEPYTRETWVSVYDSMPIKTTTIKEDFHKF